MRVILAGQRAFGTAVYDMLKEEGHQIAGVWAPENDLLRKVAQKDFLWWPEYQRNPRGVAIAKADLFVAAHSHDFISRAARDATRLGGIGYHPSLLPRHRGRDAVRWTLHMRDPVAGGSVYWLTDNVDGGPIAAQDWCHVVPGWTASNLWASELFDMGLRLLKGVLRDLEQKVIVEIPQDERVATWEPAFDRAPLFRPDVPQIGSVNGYRHVVTRS